MSIRAKLLLIFILVGVGPMLLLGFGYYRSGTRAVEHLLRADVEYRAARAEQELRAALADREARLSALAHAPAARHYLSAAKTDGAADATDARMLLDGFVRSHAGEWVTITLVRANGQPLLLAESSLAGGGDVTLKSDDALPAHIDLDERVWAAAEQAPLRGQIAHAAYGTALRYTTPVPPPAGEPAVPVGAIVAELKLDALLARAAGAPAQASARAGDELPHLFVVLDRAGQIVYHTNFALKYQQAATVMPGFADIAAAMTAGGTGAQAFQNAADGRRWFVAYRPLAGLGLSVAAAADSSAAAAGSQLFGAAGLALMLLTALVAALALALVIARTSRRINRVAEAAAEIAAGNLEQRILVQSTDETRLLAESFNLMSDRLREQIARETENKQFQSFMRLSAMLTHDLKNAITGLSMLVANMERHMHREEFRADAISSLRAATDKLRAMVARLNEPVQTLSGEYRHALAPTDLVVLIERVLQTTAAPAGAFHRIERRLPAQLVVPVDADRIERVIENLVINALEAMGTKSGQLTVEAGAEDEHQVFVSVCDTGTGMNEEFIKTRLFHPFATTKEKGIGLGLYTCREIVAAHGGRFDVKSEVGVGTCFRVVLPSEPVTWSRRISAVRSQQTTDPEAACSVDQAPQ